MKFAVATKTALILCILVHVECRSQIFSIRAGLGYGIPQASQTMDGSAAPYSGSSKNTVLDSQNYTSFNLSKVSFMSGLHGHIAGTYMFNKHLGVDLGILFGLAMQQYSFTDYNVSLGGVPYNVTITQGSQSPTFIMPSLVLQSGGNKFSCFMRFGPVVPLNTNIIQHQIYTNLPGSGAIETDDYTWQIHNRFSLGLSAATGLNYQINESVKFWCEASMMSLSVYNKEADMIDLTVNGQSGYLPQVPAAERKIIYSFNFNSSANDYYHQPSFSQPFSYLAFNIGMSFVLKSNDTKQRSNRTFKSNYDDEHPKRF